MAFKLITVLCATLAFAHGGLLAPAAYTAAYSSAPAVSHVYSSIGSLSHQPQLISQAAPVIAAPVTKIASPVIATQAVLPALKSYAAAPVLSAPIAKVAYSPATEVSHVYSSIAAPQIAYGGQLAHAAPQLAYTGHTQYAHAAPQIAYTGHTQLAHAAPQIAYSTQTQLAHAAPQIAYGGHTQYAQAAPQIAYTGHTQLAHAAPQIAYGGHAQYAAPIAISSPAIASSQQNTYRSLGGTISTYSKAVDTAFSSVRKADTRISNNVYTPALATKTIAYQQPAILEQKSIPATVVSHVAFDGLGAHYNW